MNTVLAHHDRKARL